MGPLISGPANSVEEDDRFAPSSVNELAWKSVDVYRPRPVGLGTWCLRNIDAHLAMVALIIDK